MFAIIIAGLALIGALLHIFLSKRPRTAARVLEILLIWAFAFNGILGLYSASGHIFRGPEVAAFIGWPAGNPFQFEVGIANLGVGILGLVSIWRRDDFWLAAVIMMTIFYWGAAYGHVVQIIRFNNFAPGNAGIVLYADIINPVVLIGLLVAYRLTAARQAEKIRAERPKKAA